MQQHALPIGVQKCANRVGREGDLESAAFVADLFGRILARASHDQEEVLIARRDRTRIAETRRNWLFLRDRRIDAYDGCCSVIDDESDGGWG
jgi:N-carbamoylputrescine amidase